MKKNIINILYIISIVIQLTFCGVCINDKKFNEAIPWGVCAITACILTVVTNSYLDSEDDNKRLEESFDKINAVSRDIIAHGKETIELNDKLLDDLENLNEVVKVLQTYVPKDKYQEVNDKLCDTRFSFSVPPGEEEYSLFIKKVK